MRKKPCWRNRLLPKGAVAGRSNYTPHQICNRLKCGEYNMLKCVAELGHEGDCNFVVDHKNDYKGSTP
jgi:hypothetical protein